MTLTHLESGSIFGEMALFDKTPRSANVIAVGQARILSIDKKKLFKTINRDPTLVFKILNSLSSRVRSLSDEVMALRNKKA
jgi:CRP/FNR family cyclic AMP-dependent transcriptional regulator